MIRLRFPCTVPQEESSLRVKPVIRHADHPYEPALDLLLSQFLIASIKVRNCTF